MLGENINHKDFGSQLHKGGSRRLVEPVAQFSTSQRCTGGDGRTVTGYRDGQSFPFKKHPQQLKRKDNSGDYQWLQKTQNKT